MAPTCSSLPRRVSIGIRLPSEADPFSRAGMRVGSVVPGSMAASAGLRSGDIVVRLGEVELCSPHALGEATRRAAARDDVEIELRRGGERMVVRVAVERWPSEDVPGHEVLYETLEAGGARLRAIVTHPSSATSPSAAVLYLQGIDCGSVDFAASPHAPAALLVRGWARAGLVTMRVEKRGVGDSEGGHCSAADFETELAGHRAALQWLASRGYVDPERTFVLGHGVGGRVAPLIAEAAAVRGWMLYGSSAAPWLDSLEASVRRQLALGGEPEAEAARLAALARARIERAPADRGDMLFHGRTARFHRQLAACDVARAWGAARGDALVIRGEHDWFVGPEETELLVATLAARATGSVERVQLPGFDHAFTRHATRDAALRALGRGTRDPALLDATLAWMKPRL